MGASPKTLLFDVYWSFAEPIPESPNAFIIAAREYAASIEAPDPSQILEAQLSISDIRIRYEYWIRRPDDAWSSNDIDIRIMGHNFSKLTGAELLWELHLSCANTIGRDDGHFFEGLELEGEGCLNNPPIYRLLLGS